MHLHFYRGALPSEVNICLELDKGVPFCGYQDDLHALRGKHDSDWENLQEGNGVDLGYFGLLQWGTPVQLTVLVQAIGQTDPVAVQGLEKGHDWTQKGYSLANIKAAQEYFLEGRKQPLDLNLKLLVRKSSPQQSNHSEVFCYQLLQVRRTRPNLHCQEELEGSHEIDQRAISACLRTPTRVLKQQQRQEIPPDRHRAHRWEEPGTPHQRSQHSHQVARLLPKHSLRFPGQHSREGCACSGDKKGRNNWYRFQTPLQDILSL